MVKKPFTIKQEQALEAAARMLDEKRAAYLRFAKGADDPINKEMMGDRAFAAGLCASDVRGMIAKTAPHIEVGMTVTGGPFKKKPGVIRAVASSGPKRKSRRK
jgi:hypothetical protein